jgi:hypothetical protein
MRKPLFRPILISRLAIPISPKTRSERFRALLEKWLPVRFGPRTFVRQLNGYDLRSGLSWRTVTPPMPSWGGCTVLLSDDGGNTWRNLESEETA